MANLEVDLQWHGINPEEQLLPAVQHRRMFVRLLDERKMFALVRLQTEVQTRVATFELKDDFFQEDVFLRYVEADEELLLDTDRGILPESHWPLNFVVELVLEA